MKNIYIITLLLFLSYRSFSQLTISPVSLSANLSVNEEKIFSIYINNPSNEPVLYWWKVIKPNGFPQYWQTQTCDGVLCYLWNVDKNSKIKPDTVFPNIPRLVTIHLKPDSIPGEANICFKIYSDNQHLNEINSTDCNDLIQASTSSTNQESRNEIVIYPNPTSDYFSIKNDDEITSIKIYNVMGKLVLNQKHSIGKTYSVENLESGLHFIELSYLFDKRRIQKLLINH